MENAMRGQQKPEPTAHGLKEQSDVHFLMNEGPFAATIPAAEECRRAAGAIDPANGGHKCPFH